MDVRLPAATASRTELLHQLLVSLAIGLALLLPAVLLDGYLRALSTLLFVMLALLVLRTVLAAGLTFRPAPEPPAKPQGVAWPTVSVLVPAYNEADVLPSTMASMQALDYPADKLEFVYVHEAASQDATGEIVRGFAARDPRFKAIERDEATGGKGAAANTGLDHCTGELVVSLDADHRLSPDALKRAARWFLDDPELACVRGRCVGENQDASYLARQVRVERDASEKGYIYAREVVGGFTTFGGGQAIFRRSLFEQIGRFDEEILVEDIDFSMRIHGAGLRLRIDPAIVSYEENPATFQAWWSQRKRWARGWMQVARRYLPRLHTMEAVPWRVKLDAYYTLAYGILPALIALLLPLGLLELAGLGTTSAHLPGGLGWLWTGFAVAPLVLSGAVLVQDLRDGIDHDWNEAPAYATLWLYLVLQAPVYWSAFLEEFVLDRPNVYVKTPRGAQATPKGDGAAGAANPEPAVDGDGVGGRWTAEEGA